MVLIHNLILFGWEESLKLSNFYIKWCILKICFLSLICFQLLSQKKEKLNVYFLVFKNQAIYFQGWLIEKDVIKKKKGIFWRCPELCSLSLWNIYNKISLKLWVSNWVLLNPVVRKYFRSFIYTVPQLHMYLNANHTQMYRYTIM